MEMRTKDRILIESLRLFSISGYDAVSVRAIAAKVGVRDSALYKHYKSKQAIYDAIVEECKRRYYNQYCQHQFDFQTRNEFCDMCLEMFEFQTSDEWMVMFRRMLIIEHYRNPEMAMVYKNFFIDTPIQYQTKIFLELMERGILKKSDAEVLALELYAPFVLYHSVQEDPKKIKRMLRIHAENFADNYFMTSNTNEDAKMSAEMEKK